MSVAMVNSSTIMGFIKDRKTFNSCIAECFEMLDIDGTGTLSRKELRGGFHRVLSLGYYKSEPEEETKDLHEIVFKRFDEDQNGVIDRKEFMALIRELMQAMARGIGDSPVLVALEQGSLLMKAAQHELAALASMNLGSARKKNGKRSDINGLLGICLCCHKLETCS
ncbi:hypothetical protein I3843_07G006400 [Carya illinoinensis]|uniref:EF-hand domain-containing protein n=1 Tax=Carya illinoinensis TaxID=32201 RepID=A0A8T1PPJ4_CARIL|nr:uncharacterized protein LOC122314932 [Carya illinoinensis]KAG2695244.1 hypothetical protein I3760_07G006200 [Carya illinoinensis]KAG6618202.1 hypothetical protein I3842_Q120500 [Carya illinoinensis]KAG6646389.1 hypothetical protein CIPAW_07G006600 [Carya illinoinensis]KAG6701850.1 hypothetical protein I3842_07G006500 [Carya illinoinensis]KAG7968959.1 hypothetical protein I3843_07G006400 [Carya illinoinensis]